MRPYYLMHCNENPIYVFPEKELRSLSPNFHIHVPVSGLEVPRIGQHIFRHLKRQTDCENTNPSQTHECGNWDGGRVIPFLGIFVSNFRYCVFAMCLWVLTKHFISDSYGCEVSV
jgi:hypothetical protein